jgi:hypothetical protein
MPHQIHDIITRFLQVESSLNSSTYSPLEGHGTIRLLTLDSVYDSTISCSLTTASLDDRPRYKALSYTWGTPMAIHTIYVNGFPSQITENLYRFLLIAGMCEPDSLWIDQICINQQNVAEKNHQVSMMGKIYQGASVVIAWLGEASSETENALRSFRKSSKDLVSSMELRAIFLESVKSWSSLVELFQRPYWSRVWIVQELVLAQDLIFQCGRESIDGSDMAALVQLLDLFSPAEFFQSASPGDTEWDYKFGRHEFDQVQHCFSTVDALKTLRCRRSPRRVEFFDALQATRGLMCSDPRDKIYGILGLVDADSRFEVDYTLSAQEVYLQATKTLLYMNSTRILASCGGGSHYSELLPSWCPDFFRSSSSSLPPLGKDPRSNDLSRGFRWSITDQHILVIEGKLICQVKSRFPRTWPSTRCLEPYEDSMELKLIRGYTSDINNLCLALEKAHFSLGTVDTALKPWGWRRIARQITGMVLKHQQDSQHSLSVDISRLHLLCDPHKTIVATTNGHVGLAPKETQEGDFIAALAGTSTLFVLRAVNDSQYQLLGESYIHGAIPEGFINNPSETSPFCLV